MRIAAEYPWTFDNDLFGGPDFWGLVNRQWRLCTIGQMQSPINIDPERLLFDPGLTKISISNTQIEADFLNTGQLPIITINTTSPASRHVNITGGPAGPYTYRLHNVAVHFGQAKENERGSEHTVDRVRFPAEVQLLAYNSDLYENYTEAMAQPRGLLAIGIIVDIAENTNPELRRLTVASQSITYKGLQNCNILTDWKYSDSTTKLKRFHPSQLMPSTDQYVTYDGSLTFPGCHETVTWVIMNHPIYINMEDLAIWNDLQQTETKQSNPAFMSPNYRPLKPLNGRLIRTNINVKYKSRTSGSCPSNIYLDMGYRSNPRRHPNATYATSFSSVYGVGKHRKRDLDKFDIEVFDEDVTAASLDSLSVDDDNFEFA
ncbi:Carbonic anhydrase like protein 2 precursor [Aphelenchoides avenae]|nr:Carbonic anhydrase like protein 2 precursor [Aphelenchus avenae]